jgi:predicted RNA-binding protein with PUA-like domain
MAHWLVKQEPTTYSWPRLVRDGRTRWDGVHNAQALLYLRQMAVGDEAFFYHSGDERACVGILRVVAPPRPDPDDPRPSWFVEVAPVRPLARPVALAEIRGEPALRDLLLLRNSRLSVMPLPDRAWAWILARSNAAPGIPPRATGGTKGRARSRARRPTEHGARRRR